MDTVLAGYVRALRAAGATTSTAETLDAARAVALVGYADRDNLKACLAATLAKSAQDQALHEQVFGLYFGRPAEAAQAAGTADAAAAGEAPTVEVDLALARAADAVGLSAIRFASQIPGLTAQLVEAASAMLPRVDPGTLRRAARALVQQRFELHGQPATDSFLTEVALARTLGRMAPADMARMKAAVARMARRLAQRHAHRRRVTLRGRLDVRRTIHASAAHEGVPFALHFKQKRVDKPRLVAVCDVSGSVATHARFLLLFLYALGEVVADLRCFAFSNRLIDIGPALRDLPFDDAMAVVLKEVGSGATDYGQAWVDLLDQHPEAIDRRTTVLVLGDGRSNHSDLRLDRLTEITDRARRVVWLSPEPPGRWGSGDSELLRIRPHVNHLAHCATALDLERAIDEALTLAQ